MRDKAAMGSTAPDTASTDPHADPLAAGRLATRRITRISVAVALVLILLKTFALGASGSVAVLASLADSALDLFASLATFFAVRWAAAPPDEDHRYGHGKGEAMAALVQAGLVFASAIFIGWEAIQRIGDPRPVTSGGWAVGVMVIAIAVTAWLVWMQTRAIRASGSLAVTGDRAHYSADLAANVVVLIGVISGAYLGAPGLDAAAGLIVAVWLFWGALGVLRPAADNLLDRAAPAEDRTIVVQAVLADPRIGGVHQLRTRRSGPVLIVQMHVDLDPALTLEQAHAIVVEAEGRIAERFPGANILIHADPRARIPTAKADAAAPATSGPWS